MQAIEKKAKTIDEAVELALKEMGMPKEEVLIEVIEHPSKGLLGILGARPAWVRVEAKDSPARRAKEFIYKILKAMSLDAEIDIKEEDNIININIAGDKLGIMIGRRGETLDALQYLTNLAVNKNQQNRKKIYIDIEGYRERREETLRKLAFKLADKARQRGRSVILEPMNSQERRIIHTALQGEADIITFSEGEDPYRKIIIAPKK